MSMMIAYDSVTGKILGTGQIDGAIQYNGEVPPDFNTTFGLGKYIMTNGVIVAVNGWVAPPPPPYPGKFPPHV